ncbi:MAG: response regulator [Treponema sp.]|nr:response regulator [Treponema sp.]
MKDLLIIHENHTVNEYLLHYIENSYPALIKENFNSAEIENTITKYSISNVIALIDGISPLSITELRKTFIHMNTVHFYLLGSEQSYETFKETPLRDNVHHFNTPLSTSIFKTEFQAFVNKINSPQPALNSKRSILLVDDDPVCLRNMSNWLKSFYHVSVAKSGATCISCLSKSIPDLILLDYEMPVCDGIQTLEMIRAEPDYASIPVIFLTGVSDIDKVKEALKHKPQGYILKNSGRVEFLKKINEVFAI